MIQPGEGGENGNKGIIDAIWLRINAEEQGNFWAVKRFFDQVAELLLEFCGYDFIYGRAIWSENSTVRTKVEGGKYNDWRWKPVFSGWDCNLRRF